jgi:arginine N-succinyltransferase
MVIIRPVTSGDVDALVGLAEQAGVGLTNLPKDKALVAKRVAQSLASFAHIPEHPGGETYLVVMEETESRRVIGTSGLVSKVGGFLPFYEYRIETQVFESKIIGVKKEISLLHLYETHDGPGEVGSLFLLPEFRNSGNGRFLQLCRFMFIANFPQAFETTIISEFRGVQDENRRSPFWDAVGQHFFGIDFAEADRLSVVNKRFIAELMPRHPLYIPLLRPEAQAVIGKPHPESARAVTNLEAQGFEFANMVDIFDAGPVYSCERDEIATVKNSRVAKVAEIVQGAIESPVCMISSTTADFRATRAAVVQTEHGLRLNAETARGLGVTVGDAVRFVEW